MTRSERLADLFLDAAADGAGWSEALVSLARHCRADVGSLVLIDRESGTGRGFCLGVDDAFAVPFVRSKANHVAIGSRMVAPGAVFTDRSVVDRRAFEASTFFASWAAPSRQTEYAGVAVLNDDDRFVFVGLSRGPRKGAFGDDELGEQQTLAPQIRRAARIWTALGAAEEQRRTLEAAFDQLGQPVFLLSSLGKVRVLNAAAQDLLERKVGLSMAKGRLTCAAPPLSARLQAAVQSAASGARDLAGASIAIPCGPDTEPMVLLVSPLSPSGARALADVQVMVVAVGPSVAARDAAESLRAYFGMTRTEALLAHQIAKGVGLKTAARALHIAPTTARTHLTRVFEKAGVHSQTQLAALIGAGLPLKA